MNALRFSGLATWIPARGNHYPALLLVLVMSMIAAPTAMSESSLSLQPAANDLIRPCNISGTPGQDKSTKKKTKEHASAETAGVCVEVRSGILEVQETLQAKVRELRWNIHDETLNESSWIFLRDLDVSELLGMTRQEKRPQDVEWTSGSVTIQVTTTEIEGGFTRTIITTKFRGAGETKDKLKIQHDWWPLDSNGTLENTLMDALRKHFVPPSE